MGIMHDLLEGVACDVSEYVIRYLVDNGKITVEYLNSQIENFTYRDTDQVNRPYVIAKPITFTQTVAKC
jgi:hypothetical protein